MLGLGASNSSFEVKTFQDKFQVPFPLLPDPDLTVAGFLGEQIFTPHFLVLALDGKGHAKVIYSKTGGLPKLDKFLKLIKKRAGIK